MIIRCYTPTNVELYYLNQYTDAKYENGRMVFYNSLFRTRMGIACNKGQSEIVTDLLQKGADEDELVNTLEACFGSDGKIWINQLISNGFIE